MIEMKVFMPVSLNIETGVKVKISLAEDGLYKVSTNEIEIGLGQTISTNAELKNYFQGKVISCEGNYLVVELENPLI